MPKKKLAVLLLLLHPAFVRAADLKSETLQAWDVYVRQVQLRIRDRSRGYAPFLRVDETQALTERARAGEILVEPEEGRSPHVAREYRESVLPPKVKVRIAIEQASTFGWAQYVGDSGRIIGMKTFGASAPLKELQRRFGFEPDRIVAAAKELLART